MDGTNNTNYLHFQIYRGQYFLLTNDEMLQVGHRVLRAAFTAGKYASYLQPCLPKSECT